MRALDSFAWIEYFMGSKRGARVREYVESEGPLYTPAICLTEIRSRYLREGEDPTSRLNFILDRSLIIPIDTDIALSAPDVKQRHKLHTIDAVVYASSQNKGITLVTGDRHFRDLPDTEII
ncbi:MAG: type II toxin-antitoxin system VapC family toxin [Candidatus Bathyarchaeia archaeon]